jgi:hypothetical protein
MSMPLRWPVERDAKPLGRKQPPGNLISSMATPVFGCPTGEGRKAPAGIQRPS